MQSSFLVYAFFEGGETDGTAKALGLRIRCGITYSTLQNVAGGRNRSVTVETIHKICIGLDMELMEFFDSELFRNQMAQKIL